eukprot:CAMPEP_0170634720 /NCGR_PEP_ID=MMETSP0224-20130122/36779_1 /TAXON_ID=285029 /ORGANISM="Togula jolla, Strain CCCM 725" /LENGTH=77 /DNA_ID=CAMNT_0010964053 /DNA_START=224 /DNA_END=457 /DNA_ORIENTATION=+
MSRHGLIGLQPSQRKELHHKLRCLCLTSTTLAANEHRLRLATLADSVESIACNSKDMRLGTSTADEAPEHVRPIDPR